MVPEVGLEPTKPKAVDLQSTVIATTRLRQIILYYFTSYWAYFLVSIEIELRFFRFFHGIRNFFPFST